MSDPFRGGLRHHQAFDALVDRAQRERAQTLLEVSRAQLSRLYVIPQENPAATVSETLRGQTLNEAAVRLAQRLGWIGGKRA